MFYLLIKKRVWQMKKSFKRISAIILSVLVVTVSMSACGTQKNQNSNEQSSKQSTVSQTNEASKNEPDKKETKYVNPLTGLATEKDISTSRPVAVMINNIEYAQPLMGISKADVIYECLVEGGITRLEAIYKDASNVGKIGSIRSARPPFIDLARGFQAVYIHCGTSKQANEILKQDVINSFDLGKYSSWAWRDSERIDKGYSVEHTLVTDGKTVVGNAKDNGVKMTISNNYSQKFGNNSQVDTGKSAVKISAKFSNYKTTSFEYNKKEKTYIVSQFGEEMFDSTYNTHNTAENVLVLNVNSYLIDDEHVNLDLVGNGEGYYMNGGKAIKIKWSKSSSDSPIEYTLENGEELIMKPGRQYVCCIPLSNEAEYS